MTHIAGHVYIPEGSFGILRPIKYYNPNKHSDKYPDKWNPNIGEIVPFPMLFVPPSGKLRLKATKDSIIGFQPHLIPWSNGKYLAIACDTVPLKTHIRCEEKVMSAYRKNRKKFEKSYGKLEEMNGPYQIKRLEEVAKKVALKPDEKIVLSKTLNYMKSPSFNRIYKKNKNTFRSNEEVIDWIVDHCISLRQAGLIQVNGIHFLSASIKKGELFS